MAKPIYGLIPPGGWHYYDGDVRLVGYSLENLYEVVRNYRAENHLPQNDVEGDVNSFLCGNFPQNCHGVDMVVVQSVVPPNRQSELLHDITIWSKNILTSNKKINYVSDELAEARAKICLNCTKNLNWRAGCGACIAATDRITSSIRHGRDTHSSKVLGGCSIMRHDNRSAIFLDKDNFIKPQSLPEMCWINENV
jgi:hypothetical protein